MQFDAYCDAIYQAFDNTVDSGTDAELFYAGYLNGHFSLVHARCESQSIDDLQEQMQQSLSEAFSAGELEPQEQQAVTAFWYKVQPD